MNVLDKRHLDTHPEQSALRDFALGRLSEESHAAVEEHVASCDVCLRVLRETPNDTLADRLRQSVTPNERRKEKSSERVEDREPLFLSIDDASHASAAFAMPRELENHPRYEIVRPIGAGGMGVVFEARHKMMDRRVALKLIHRSYLKEATALERFRQEVQSAARLDSPYIVRAHDAEQAGDVHFLVMEYVDGESLSHLVQSRGPLSVRKACGCARHAALGLAHAHQHGMVHRDIKPQNLMLSKGVVKILDFGLARIAREHDAPEIAASTIAGAKDATGQGLTAAGVLLGTPDYIAPEQAFDSRGADIRADIYSLGCTLYYLLAGRSPFPEGSAVEKVMSHVGREAEPLTNLRRDVSPELSAIVARMMAKAPADRPQSPLEVAELLAPFCKGENEMVKPPPAPLREIAPPPLLAPFNTSFDTPIEAPSTVGSPIGTLAWSPLLPANARPPTQLAATPTRMTRPWLFVAFAAALVGALLSAGFALRGLGSFFEEETPVASGAQGARASLSPSAQTSFAPSTAPREDSNAAPAAVGLLPALLVVPHSGVWYPDYEPVARELRNSQIPFRVAATRTGAASAYVERTHPSVTVDLRLADVQLEDYSGVVFLGGAVEEYIRGEGSEAARTVISQAESRGLVLASLCRGTEVLAASGALRGKQAAQSLVFDGTDKQSMASCGAHWVEFPTARDGRLVTGRDDKAAEAFARELVLALREEAAAR